MSGLTVMPSGHSFWTEWMKHPLLGLALLKVDTDVESEPCSYLPRCRQSFIENDCISASNFESTGNTWSTSYLFLSDLDVPLGHF